ncbi:hypothetical protein RAH57_09055 [Chryseobacterium sp. CKR4-1]|uniref:hypothetical protein n=1 Tax=Chryseobacterium sp. CKR4-1 TaxID=3068896 RepID=UPI002796C8D9|nr:hypothetical protein [Chryseobacterium sp. CKR4-1]MDQ1804135.1 hypothetical protein [Chryseobacterium sp. CKR4-1]
MQLHNKLFFLSILLSLNFVSCQSKKFYYSKYGDLSIEKKQEVNEYLEDLKKDYPKKDNEILLMLGYNCFLNQSILINNSIKKDFPKTNSNTDGRTVMVLVEKKRIIL